MHTIFLNPNQSSPTNKMGGTEKLKRLKPCRRPPREPPIREIEPRTRRLHLEWPFHIKRWDFPTPETIDCEKFDNIMYVGR